MAIPSPTVLRVLAFAGLLAFAAACGEAVSAERRSVAVTAASPGTLAPVLDETLTRDLVPPQAHRRSLALEAGGEYTVQVHYTGSPPALLGGPQVKGDHAPLQVIPGEAVDGVVEGILRPTATEVSVEVRALGGPCTIERLVVRRWGAAGVPSRARASSREPQALEVFSDHRVGFVLPVGEPLTLRHVVPEAADALVFDVVADSTRPPAEALPPGLAVRVRLLSADGTGTAGFPVDLGVTPVEGGRAVWQPVRLEAPRGLPAGDAVLHLECVAEASSPGAPGVSLSVPSWRVESGPRRPNVVLVSLDTTRPDHLSAYGYERPTTPNLDALSARSALFEAASSTASYTLPAHASMLSGQYPTTHGAEHPAHAVDPARTPLLAALLQAEGYATRAFTGGGYLDADFGFAHGFDGYSNHDPVVPISGPRADALASWPGGRRLYDARLAQHWTATLEWVERQAEVPFFLFFQTFAIHDYRPDVGYRGRFGGPDPGEGVRPLRRMPEQIKQPYTEEERAQLVDLYDEAILEVDAVLGELFATLERLQLTGHTIVVITADHGEDFGEHLLEGAPVVGHGQALWESLLHVPLIVHVPGLEGRRIGQRVSTVDVTPTLLDLVGVPAPAAMQGRSLRPLLETGRGQGSPVLAELHSNRGHARTLCTGDLKLVTGDPTALVDWPVPTPVRLFDLASDRLEERDAAPAQAGTTARLQQSMDDLVTALRADRQGAGAAQATLDPETLRRLEELGYLGDG